MIEIYFKYKLIAFIVYYLFGWCINDSFEDKIKVVNIKLWCKFEH